MTRLLSRTAWDARCRAIEARPFPASMAAMDDDAAARWGERPALIFIGGETLSFEALRRRVNRVANMPRARGVKRGDRVAVMAPNLPAVPATWLALAKLVRRLSGSTCVIRRASSAMCSMTPGPATC